MATHKEENNKNDKPKKSLLKRIKDKITKSNSDKSIDSNKSEDDKSNFVTTQEQAKQRITEKAEEFKALAEVLKSVLRPEPLSNVDTVPSSIYLSGEAGANESVYFYDFLKEWNNNGSFDGAAMMGVTAFNIGAMNNGADIDTHPDSQGGFLAVGEGIENIKDKEPRLQLKPCEVFNELETIPSPVTLENLEEKIAMFQLKEKFIKHNNYAKKEIIDFKVRLENRRKYNQYKDFFEKFDCTSSEKINKLVSKYDLVLETSDLFIATFPDEAIIIMNDYEQKTLELCGKKPIFYVIGEKKDFKKKYERNDPILLAQSPFGIYWNILGVWDKEILILSEL